MEHGEDILRYDRILGMEDPAETPQRVFPPFGRCMIDQLHFPGRGFTAYSGFDRRIPHF